MTTQAINTVIKFTKHFTKSTFVTNAKIKIQSEWKVKNPKRFAMSECACAHSPPNRQRNTVEKLFNHEIGVRVTIDL